MKVGRCSKQTKHHELDGFVEHVLLLALALKEVDNQLLPFCGSDLRVTGTRKICVHCAQRQYQFVQKIRLHKKHECIRLVERKWGFQGGGIGERKI